MDLKPETPEFDLQLQFDHRNSFNLCDPQSSHLLNRKILILEVFKSLGQKQTFSRVPMITEH